MEDPVYRKLMDYSMRALSRRAHTAFELRQKLKKRPGVTSALEDQVLRRLEELKLIDDEAYLRTAIELAIRIKPQGRFSLANRLRQKGIPMEQTETTWRKMELDEKALAQEALNRAHKRFNRVPPEKLYQRQVQFLASRGFSPEVVRQLLYRNH